MAKIIYAPAVQGYVGTIGTGVYFRTNSTKFGLVRNWVMPRASTSTAERGSWIANLSKIWTTDALGAGKLNFTAYGQLYKNLPVYGEGLQVRTASSFAIWYKAIYNWSVDDGNIDLATVTFEDMQTALATIGTVKDLVDNGFLPAVDGYEDFDEPWLTSS